MATWAMVWTRDCCWGPPNRGATVSITTVQSVTTSARAGGAVAAAKRPSTTTHRRPIRPLDLAAAPVARRPTVSIPFMATSSWSTDAARSAFAGSMTGP